MRMILPFLSFFSRKSNFLDNRDTSKKQLGANWSMGGIKEILSRFGNNKWEWLLGGGQSARKHRIGDFGDSFSVADQHPWWIFVFFRIFDHGETTKCAHESHISSWDANDPYYRFLTKHPDSRMIYALRESKSQNMFLLFDLCDWVTSATENRVSNSPKTSINRVPTPPRCLPHLLLRKIQSDHSPWCEPYVPSSPFNVTSRGPRCPFKRPITPRIGRNSKWMEERIDNQCEIYDITTIYRHIRFDNW